MKRKALSLAIAATLFAGGLMAQESQDPNAKPGGTAVVTYQNDVATLDPAIGYDWQNWSMIKSLFDGLMDYKPGTTELVKDLAEDYSISDDGTVYTFTLKKGVKFHNGREMKASDVKYSLERTVNPKTQSPGAGFFSSIAGYQDMAEGKADSLSGIEVVDDYQLKITLSEANATFLHVMAINFASVVPKEAVEQWGEDFGKHPVGTARSALKNGSSASAWCSRKTRNTSTRAFPIWTASPSKSGRTRASPCCAWRRAKSTSLATACRQRASCSFARTRNSRTCWWSVTSCTPVT